MTSKTKIISRKAMTRLCAIGLTVALASGAFMTGCAGQTANTASNTTSQAAASVVKDIDLAALDFEYTDRDKNPSYDESAAVKVKLEGSSASVEGSAAGVTVDGSTVTISKEGAYVFSGSLTNGQIVVECNKDDKAKVQLVLNGVTITNQSGPAIRINQAKKCFITLADGSENKLSDGEGYVLDEGSDEPYATIYSKDDLTLQGSGTLTVNAQYRHGIVSKDSLVVTGGTYNVTAVEDALRGRDSLKVCGGTFNLQSGQDAMKSNNDEEATAGYISIDGGTFNITAGDDAIHAETALVINAGSIDIAKSYEGLEGQQIYINGGDINLIASDDGLNAAVGSSSDSPLMGAADQGQNHKFDLSEAKVPASPESSSPGQRPAGPDNQAPGGRAQGGPGGSGVVSSEDATKIFLKITGGTLHVNAAGDGLDSNGSLEITGGTVIVDGPASSGDGALDYNASAIISGGTVLAVGSAGMAEGFTGGSQPFGMVAASGNVGSKIEVRNASGTVIASMTATKQFGNVVFSAPGLSEGEQCTIVVDGQSYDATASMQPTEKFGQPGFGGQGFEGMKREGKQVR